MPRAGFEREYEIAWDIPEGDAVFPEFDGKRMVRTDLRPLPGARPLRGWDFGHVCPVVLVGQLDVWGRLQILQEVVLRGAPLEALIDAANAAVIELWGGPRECFDAGDPAGEKMTDLGQVRQILMARGIMLRTMRSTEGSYAALRSRFLAQTIVSEDPTSPASEPSPKFLVHPRCSHLISALGGGFHKSPHDAKKLVDKHPDKDVCDALRYLNDNLMGAQSDRQQQIRDMARADWQW